MASYSTKQATFYFSDAETRSVSMGNFAPANTTNFKARVKAFNSADYEAGLNYTDLSDTYKSDSGGILQGIKSAQITTTEKTAVFSKSDSLLARAMAKEVDD